MNSIILCEGLDDVFILGYYLHKSIPEPKWVYKPNEKISSNFVLPIKDKRSQTAEVYVRGNDKTVIMNVRGKDSFTEPLSEIIKINNHFPLERFEKVYIIRDKDTDSIQDVIEGLQSFLNAKGWNINLSNNTICSGSYTSTKDEEQYTIQVVPIIIPFDKDGAVETILADAIELDGEEEKLIVQRAKEYIGLLVESGKITKYLNKERLKVKAVFSAIISATNPDRSTALINSLFMTHEWEKKKPIKDSFQLLEKLHE